MIFRKLITRESSVVVAIEADSMKEADRAFNEWCEKDNNLDNLNSTLSEKERDIEGYVASFNNWEELNRSTVKCPDFIIEKPDDEPKYDLYIFIDDRRKYSYTGLNMKRVAQELEYYNTFYKLTKVEDIGLHFNDIKIPTKNYIMAFEAVHRIGG